MKSVSILAVLVAALAVGAYSARADEKPSPGPIAVPEPPPPAPASAGGHVSFAQWQAEVLDAVLRARPLLLGDPATAEATLETVRDRVTASDLSAAEKELLEKRIGPTLHVARPRREIEERNEAVRDRVRREREGRLEAGRIVADGADQYEGLLREGRWAEADALSYDLGEIDPGNPASEAMFWKLRFAPYQFDWAFGSLYPDSYVDPFAFDYYPYTVPWHNYGWRVYTAPLAPPGPHAHEGGPVEPRLHRGEPRPDQPGDGTPEAAPGPRPQPRDESAETTGKI